MENSMGSYRNKSFGPKGTTDDCSEESGWTAYLEDFSNCREHSFSSSSGTSSLVSDAASCAAWKISQNNNNHVAACSANADSLKIPKRLCFKKTRTKIISVDDALEDTASSPVNSPKVSDLKLGDTNPRKTDDQKISSLGKGDILEHYPELQTDERSEMNINGKNNDCTDLKKRGLCLVPLSKLVNYFG